MQQGSAHSLAPSPMHCAFQLSRLARVRRPQGKPSTVLAKIALVLCRCCKKLRLLRLDPLRHRSHCSVLMSFKVQKPPISQHATSSRENAELPALVMLVPPAQSDRFHEAPGNCSARDQTLLSEHAFSRSMPCASRTT